MKKIISAHNSKIWREEQQVQQLKEKEQEQQQPDQQEVQAPKKRGRKKKQKPVDGTAGCSCKGTGKTCPRGGQCLTEELVYRAKVTDQNGKTEFYTGLTAGTFKKRLYGHESDFRNREQDGTRLSAHIWELKDANLTFDIDWEIAARAKQFNPATKKMPALPN